VEAVAILVRQRIAARKRSRSISRAPSVCRHWCGSDARTAGRARQGVRSTGAEIGRPAIATRRPRLFIGQEQHRLPSARPAPVHVAADGPALGPATGDRHCQMATSGRGYGSWATPVGLPAAQLSSPRPDRLSGYSRGSTPGPSRAPMPSQVALTCPGHRHAQLPVAACPGSSPSASLKLP
jgi:hypothetical protein